LQAIVLRTEDIKVATYRIFAVCNACGDLHTTETTVSLPVGPVSKQSIADAYANKDPPIQIVALKDMRVHCPKIGRHYAQKDDKKIFLIPIT
jgi:hypothetical protein